MTAGPAINGVARGTINGSEAICNTINGQLKGLSFEGKTEPGK